jgi:hypothetical protein
MMVHDDVIIINDFYNLGDDVKQPGDNGAKLKTITQNETDWNTEGGTKSNEDDHNYESKFTKDDSELKDPLDNTKSNEDDQNYESKFTKDDSELKEP